LGSRCCSPRYKTVANSMGWLSAASICVLWPTVQDYYFAELACGAKERHPEQSTNRLRRAMATASAICVCFYIVLLGSLGSLLAERPCGAGEGRCALMFPSRTDYKRPLRLQLQTAGFVGCMRVLYVHVACWWGCVVMVVLAQSAMAMAILCDIMAHILPNQIRKMASAKLTSRTHRHSPSSIRV
jgi:hypothetical protein